MELRGPRRVCPLLPALCVIVACSAPSTTALAPGGAGPAPPQRKSITIALQAEVNALGAAMNQVGIITNPSRFFHEFVNAYLTYRDQNDDVRPWIAAELPSVEAGTWNVAADGTMALTWKLRSGIRWHDGHELTADDVKFSWEAAREPVTQLRPQGLAGFITAVDVLDPQTVVLRWRQTTYKAGELSEDGLDILPRHVLEEALLADKETFSNHPYFSSPDRFVGSGAYRPVSWDRGTQLAVEAFDGYFLGRPKIDRVTFVFIRDANTALATMLAGAADMSFQAVPVEQAKVIREEWAKTDAGIVEMQLNHVRHLLPQLRAEQASPGDLLNLQVRRALLYAMDRADLAEATVSGIGEAKDSVTHPSTAIGKAAAGRVVTYPHDPTRASALLEGAGWQRGSDGMLQRAGSSGTERFTLEYRTLGAGDSKALFPVLQQQYRAVGVDLQYFEVVTADTPVDTAIYPGLWFTSAIADSNTLLNRFNSRQIATAQNRYTAGNRNGYASPASDRIIDAIERAFAANERAQNWAEYWRVLTDELPLLPMYSFPNPYLVRRGLTGVLPANPLSPPSHFVHLWDVQ